MMRVVSRNLLKKAVEVNDTTQDGRVAERTQIVDLSSIHEKHQDPEQISAEGERKKGVNIATNDNDKSKLGKECSGQIIKEHGGDQTTVEANLDEESPQDEKVSVAEERKEVDGERDSSRNRGWSGERATEECGVKPTTAEVERKENIEVIKNGGDCTLCDWRGELGQVERHVKDVHGSEALKRITKEDNPPSNTAQHHRQQPCPVHSQHRTHHCPVHHHHHHGNVVPNISFHHVHRTQRGVNIHHQVPGHSQYSLDSDNSHQISPQVSLSEAREQVPLNSVASAQQSLGLNFGRIRVSFPVEGQSMSSDVSGDRMDTGGGRQRESVGQTQGSHTTLSHPSTSTNTRHLHDITQRVQAPSVVPQEVEGELDQGERRPVMWMVTSLWWLVVSKDKLFMYNLVHTEEDLF